eukprot:TRINITY_DN1941_c0_g1_i1.p1 TRINITY_DN1941_c0_g1~~TRINITY_DN1941_c0_g1_i1.p1  ORF type:complete len:436 (+),score=117.35 TRINITY_DN1941_c0_g1_i1:672-1979(+)
MEAFLVEATTGEQHAVDIGVDDLAEAVKSVAHAVFCFPPDSEPSDLQLLFEGEVLCDEEPLSSAGVHGGCDIVVELTPHRFLDALRTGTTALRDVPLWVRAQHSAVLVAVAVDPRAFQFAPESLRADRTIALAAAKSSPHVMPYLPKPLKADREIVLEAVASNAQALKSAHKSLKADRDFILQVKERNPEALQYAHSSLLQHRDILLAALQHSPSLGRDSVPDSLRTDPEIAIAVAATSPWVLRSANISSPDLVWKALKAHPDALQFMNYSVLQTKEYVLAAVRANPKMWIHAAYALQSDVDVIFAALEHKNVLSLKEVLAYPRSADRELLLRVVPKYPEAVSLAWCALLSDKGFFADAVHLNPAALQHVPKLVNDWAFIVSVMKRTPLALKYVNLQFAENRELNLLAFSQDPAAFQYVHASLKDDPEIVAAAAR